MAKTELREIYRCDICGNVIEIVNTGSPSLVCCGKPMIKLIAKSGDEGKEKHIPVIEELGDKVIVKIGSIPHPMENDHYIVFIEVMTERDIFRRELKPGDNPSAIFNIKKSEIKEVREYCNKHMLWKA
ncbi:MAG: desulfoferrodoxin [bacterium (Candidatus Stahlbacteria) CG23_combo_of_CG06-09_8_20_14_all_34_7]|nr:MAG: desulfoferrodoxin [bacterium (Candidatus Stahlbacteria) CG23_combo_of_CG06-09_8_20_14_all_34_7]